MNQTLDIQVLVGSYLSYQSQKPIVGIPMELYDPANYILALPGKRIRPVLCILGYGLFQDSVESALPLAHAVEVFHNFTLVHDDIIDDAPFRRGKQTVHEHWDTNRAILSGDMMLVRSYDMLTKLDTDPQTKIQIIQKFNTMAEDVCRGQQLDVNFERKTTITEADYIEMIRLKTSVLLGFCIEAGALLGKSDEQSAEALYQYGINIGLAFQIMDDYLDAFGKTEQVGKQTGGDIIADKKTILWIELMRKISDSDLTLIESEDWDSVEEKVTLYIDLFRKYEVDNYALTTMNRYFAVAEDYLKTVKAVNSTNVLSALTESLKNRES